MEITFEVFLDELHPENEDDCSGTLEVTVEGTQSAPYLYGDDADGNRGMWVQDIDLNITRLDELVKNPIGSPERVEVDYSSLSDKLQEYIYSLAHERLDEAFWESEHQEERPDED